MFICPHKLYNLIKLITQTHIQSINFKIKINERSSLINYYQLKLNPHQSFTFPPSMQEQLRRIKNKDLKCLDQRLFGNLDKVQTINSTIQNLGQFQQFLLKQITQFQQKAKTKNKSKQVAQVIEMNCLTLRESIMNVVPDDMEGSRSRMRQTQTINSPINGFRSTRTGFNKRDLIITEQQSFRVHESKETELMRRVEELELFKQNSIKRQEVLKEQLKQLNKAKSQEAKSLRQVEVLKQQNKRVKEQYKKLKEQNAKILKQLQSYSEQAMKKKHIQQLFQTPFHVSTQLTKTAQHSTLLRKSQLKQQPNQPQQYMSFNDKMKFEFTHKLNKYHNSQINLQKNLQQSQNPQASDTFRQSDTVELTAFESSGEPQNCLFRSIDASKEYDSDFDPNVPKLLKRNSIAGLYPLNNASHQTFSSKHRVALSSYDSNIGVRSQYQSAQKPVQVKNDTSTAKKVNHDLMRKTKSNFFKPVVENKQNSNCIIDTFYDTNIAKMKGLVNQSNLNERKRNSQSKQKLKIFSMM